MHSNSMSGNSCVVILKSIIFQIPGEEDGPLFSTSIISLADLESWDWLWEGNDPLSANTPPRHFQNTNSHKLAFCQQDANEGINLEEPVKASSSFVMSDTQDNVRTEATSGVARVNAILQGDARGCVDDFLEAVGGGWVEQDANGGEGVVVADGIEVNNAEARRKAMMTIACEALRACDEGGTAKAGVSVF